MVIAAFPLIQEQVLTRNQGKVSGAVVQGMRYEDLINRSTISDSISRTSKAAYSLDQGIIIGSHLAGVLGTRVGDKIQLVSPSSTATVVGNVPRARTYRVIGIFNVDMYEYDRSFIFMPLKLAQLHFKYGRNVSDVQIRIKNPDEATALRLDFTEMLGSQFKVHDWKQRNSTYFGVLEVEKNVMFVILLLIILVAAFNIISSMIMVVRSKYRQIAILRTIGVSSGQIMRIFFINGALLGLCGTLLGTVCGILFAIYIEPIRSFVENVIGTKLFPSEIYFLSKLPTRIDATEVIVICVLALLISFAATIYPAWKASRVDPIEAFRNE
tara:strand:- start:53 stop:1030 length:978 start_codon:yes stop_codon:yes gene_type:complete